MVHSDSARARMRTLGTRATCDSDCIVICSHPCSVAVTRSGSEAASWLHRRSLVLNRSRHRRCQRTSSPSCASMESARSTRALSCALRTLARSADALGGSGESDSAAPPCEHAGRRGRESSGAPRAARPCVAASRQCGCAHSNLEARACAAGTAIVEAWE